MASYAPVYRLPTSRHSFLARQQKRLRKRKRGGDADESADDGDSAVESDEQKVEDEISSPVKLEALQDEPRVLHPVNKKDPYYIAGWAREKPLPGGNFPHAAVRDGQGQKANVEEELAKLKPPIYAPKRGLTGPVGSLKGRHLDNLTAILHSCMLKQDWTRAARVWGLILRTEVGGFGPDIRRHGRWKIGAELLMRRQQATERPSLDSGDDPGVPFLPDDSFQLVREYYERMCLQYPQLARSHHSTVTAYAIYPAFFNVWLHQVQDRSKRARQKLAALHESKTDFDDSQSVHHDSVEHKRALRQVRTEELSAVAPITTRLDELLLSPPFDTSSELLQLRGMISLWLANLHTVLGEMNNSSEEDDEHDGANEPGFSRTRHRTQADLERAKAREMFLRVVNKGMQLSAENLTFLEGDSSRLDDADED